MARVHVDNLQNLLGNVNSLLCIALVDIKENKTFKFGVQGTEFGGLKICTWTLHSQQHPNLNFLL